MWGETTSIVENAAMSSLEALQATSKNKKKGAEIYKKACELDLEFEDNIGENSFKTHLSTLSRNSESRIAKDPGSHGYYLKEETQNSESVGSGAAPVSEISVGQETATSERKQNEKLLYPILSAWLQSLGYRTKDTSQMKKMGRWGNPDLTGIIVDESLGSFDIELATIEAKITEKDFRYDFFEAVSHKRFANRVYFAFASTSNFLRESNEELRYYSELYGVGVVVIAIEEAHFIQYTDGNLSEIDTDLVDVYELFSAPFEQRLRRWQKTFLEELGISNTQELWKWGSA